MGKKWDKVKNKLGLSKAEEQTTQPQQQAPTPVASPSPTPPKAPKPMVKQSSRESESNNPDPTPAEPVAKAPAAPLKVTNPSPRQIEEDSRNLSQKLSDKLNEPSFASIPRLLKRQAVETANHQKETLKLTLQYAVDSEDRKLLIRDLYTPDIDVIEDLMSEIDPAYQKPEYEPGLENRLLMLKRWVGELQNTYDFIKDPLGLVNATGTLIEHLQQKLSSKPFVHFTERNLIELSTIREEHSNAAKAVTSLCETKNIEDQDVQKSIVRAYRPLLNDIERLIMCYSPMTYGVTDHLNPSKRVGNLESALDDMRLNRDQHQKAERIEMEEDFEAQRKERAKKQEESERKYKEVEEQLATSARNREEFFKKTMRQKGLSEKEITENLAARGREEEETQKRREGMTLEERIKALSDTLDESHKVREEKLATFARRQEEEASLASKVERRERSSSLGTLQDILAAGAGGRSSSPDRSGSPSAGM